MDESTEVARGVVDKIKAFANGIYDNISVKFKRNEAFI